MVYNKVRGGEGTLRDGSGNGREGRGGRGRGFMRMRDLLSFRRLLRKLFRSKSSSSSSRRGDNGVW